MAAVLTELADLSLQSEVLALPAAAEVSQEVSLCHLSSRQGQMILRDLSCYGAGRLSFSSDCFCVTMVSEGVFSS